MRKLYFLSTISAFAIILNFTPFNVSITGVTTYQEMKQLIENAGVYLLTTRETFGIGTIEALAGDYLAGRSHVALIDFHTGLGPRGHGELISVDAPGGAEHLRTVAWYGDQVTTPSSGDASAS